MPSALPALATQLQVELGSPDRHDPQMAVDAHEVAVFESFRRVAHAVDAGDANATRAPYGCPSPWTHRPAYGC
jgi:hypothetical protein